MTGLADRLTAWMAANRPVLDELMAQQGSRAIHEEFILAEGGTLPDRAARVARARSASATAWLRFLARAVEAEAPAAAGTGDAVGRLVSSGRERLEALVLEERAAYERRGASGDPEADARDAELSAWCRLFAESLATASDLADPEAPPAFAARLAAWSRAQETRRREVEAGARAAWASGPPGGGERMSAAPDADELRVQEAAAVWAHVSLLTEALEHTLGTPPSP
ncbi:MAG: hypothetical protein AB7V62_15145 [Thermoleophilia bacterium]